MSYGEEILRFRARHNLSQAKVAKLFGVQVNMIFRYEKGKALPSKTHRIRFEEIMKKLDEQKVEE